MKPNTIIGKHIGKLSLWTLSLILCLVTSCTGEDNKENHLSARTVTFLIDMTYPEEASNNQNSPREKKSQQIQAESLAPEAIAATTSDGIELFLSEEAGIYVQNTNSTAQLRASVATSITSSFSTIGYRGTSSSSISTLATTPWFYNKEVLSSGRMVTPIYWEWEDGRYGKFYAVYPQVKASYGKLSLSSESHTGIPYIDFEVEADVEKQKDLMTACSGIVHYASQGVAPQVNLAFRHALTAVRFAVGDNLAGKSIERIEIREAKSKGRYSLGSNGTSSDALWSEQSAPTTFTLAGVNISTDVERKAIITGTAEDNHLFYMLPQKLEGVTAYFLFTDGTYIHTPLVGEWKAGTYKTYTLSRSTSAWEYSITATSPDAVSYDQSTVSNYSITSYRSNGTVSQPIPWKVVGYQESLDGGVSWSDVSSTPPSWLRALSTTRSNGSLTAERGTATLQTTSDIVDYLARRNKSLQEATPKGTADNYYNLSNAHGGADVENTANCYIISAPGYYKLPLVYGNAIKGGSNNEKAYKTDNSGTSILSHFRDHLNKNITSPWITETSAGAYLPTQAEVLWADEKGLLEDITIEGSGTNAFIKFRVTSSGIRSGNAVIGVKGGNRVFWSWHLWFAPEQVLETIAVKNQTDYTYRFSAEPLGFKYTLWRGTAYQKPRIVRVQVQQAIDDNGKYHSSSFEITQNPYIEQDFYATLYQFGRKDAMPGIVNIPEGSFTPDGKNMMGIREGIQNPTTFYTGGTSWINGYNYYNLWSMENTTVGYSDNPVVKTIYDPSPVGFHLPPSNAFTGFTTKGENTRAGNEFNVTGTWNKGWSFRTNLGGDIYFPALGQRQYGNGKLENVGSGGYYWTAIPYSNREGCDLYIQSEGVNPRMKYNRAQGYAIRPIAEE